MIEQDEEYRQERRAEHLKHVRALRREPDVLLWMLLIGGAVFSFFKSDQLSTGENLILVATGTAFLGLFYEARAIRIELATDRHVQAMRTLR